MKLPSFTFRKPPVALIALLVSTSLIGLGAWQSFSTNSARELHATKQTTKYGSKIGTTGAKTKDEAAGKPGEPTQKPSDTKTSKNTGTSNAEKQSQSRSSGRVWHNPVLVFSPSTINFGTSLRKYVDVADANGRILGFPYPSTPSGINYISMRDDIFVPQTLWRFQVSRSNLDVGGQDYITFNTKDGSHFGKLLVTWEPSPYFDIKWGDLTRTSEDANTVTYTASFSIEPHNFKNTTLRYGILDPSNCLNSDTSTSVTYGGQNNLSLSCVLPRTPPTPPGQVGPIGGAKPSFKVTIEATAYDGYVSSTSYSYHFYSQENY